MTVVALMVICFKGSSDDEIDDVDVDDNDTDDAHDDN